MKASRLRQMSEKIRQLQSKRMEEKEFRGRKTDEITTRSKTSEETEESKCSNRMITIVNNQMTSENVTKLENIKILLKYLKVVHRKYIIHKKQKFHSETDRFRERKRE